MTAWLPIIHRGGLALLFADILILVLPFGTAGEETVSRLAQSPTATLLAVPCPAERVHLHPTPAVVSSRKQGVMECQW